jgi:putative hemolysin
LTVAGQFYDGIPAQLTGHDFLVRLVQELGVSLEAGAGEMRRIPAAGPTIVVANHPFGAVEGILLAEMLLRIRPDVKILANHLLGRFPQMRELLIPVDPFGGAGATRRNLRPMREALRWLDGGGLLVVFPAGEVSHLKLARRAISDSPWNENLPALSATPARRCCRSSRRRQQPPLPVGGLLHPSLRTALLPRELLTSGKGGFRSHRQPDRQPQAGRHRQ